MKKYITGLLLLTMSNVAWSEDLYLSCLTSLKLMTRGSADEGPFAIRSWRVPIFFSLAGEDPVVRVGNSRRNIGRQIVMGVSVTEDSETALKGTMRIKHDSLGSWTITKPGLELDMKWGGPVGYWGHLEDSIGNLYRPHFAYGAGKCQVRDRYWVFD